jgi:hypothetical protein
MSELQEASRPLCSLTLVEQEDGSGLKTSLAWVGSLSCQSEMQIEESERGKRKTLQDKQPNL